MEIPSEEIEVTKKHKSYNQREMQIQKAKQ